tara:strand:+ start:161 stop:397 length:237 start_codon:yes stop_codon:yes gene_type:complete
METVKKTDNYTVFKKRNGRYSVQGKNKKWINGDEKAKILADEGLIKLSVAAPAPKEEAPAEEAAPAAEATTEEVQPEA